MTNLELKDIDQMMRNALLAHEAAELAAAKARKAGELLVEAIKQMQVNALVDQIALLQMSGCDHQE